MKEIVNNSFTENKIQLIESGKAYFNLLIKLILNATENIHIQTYIFNNDETGESIVNALKIASLKNVQIYLLVDGYASKNLSEKFIENLQIEKINFRFFKPFFKNNNFYFGRRLHHKMIVIDSKFAVVGGLNIADRYNDCKEVKAWLDYAILLEGPIAKELCILCWKSWNGYKINKTNIYCKNTNPEFKFIEKETALCTMRRNDWVRNKNEISKSYQKIIKNANQEIIIICSYFIPGQLIRKKLKQTALRGVNIKLILASQSDVKIAKSAERWMYDWLLRNNIRIYEYQPTVLHAKMAVVDGNFVTIGSYNINNISEFASIELNIDVQNKLFAEEVTSTLNKIIAEDCVEITNDSHLKDKTIFKLLYYWICYKIYRISFFLCTFYFKRQE